MNHPRILVISNNSFSLTNSNGRTLGNLFIGWPKECLAQFCISTDGPNFDVCDNYYCVGDRAALKSFITLTPARRNSLQDFTKDSDVAIPANRIKRTPIKSIIRHIVWSSRLWSGKEFRNWLEEFRPQIVIIQSGDTAFTHNIASRIARKYDAKLVFFNTEGFYFMKRNYLYKGFLDKIFFPVYRHIYNRLYSKSMGMTSYCFYLNDLLKTDNDTAFNVPSEVIYNSSDCKPSGKPFNSDSPSFTYIGNFGFGRPHALVDVANVLQELNPDYELHVYGRANSEAREIFKKATNLIYEGFVSYGQTQNIMAESSIIFHVEGQEESYQESLRYGFSTKISDSLSIGVPFLIYSSPRIAGHMYLKDNGIAWAATNKEDLKKQISEILHNPDIREKRLANAKAFADMNHDISKNSARFQSVLCSLVQ